MKYALALAALIVLAAATANSWLPLVAPHTVGAYCDRHPNSETCTK